MLPNDDINFELTDYFRAAPMAGAVFGNYRVCTQAFFVPSRILWTKFQDFITGGATGTSQYNPPVATVRNFYETIKDIYPASLPVSKSAKAGIRDLFNLYIDMGLPLQNNFPTLSDSETLVYPAIDADLAESKVSLLPFRAVSKVWFDWFRDSNLISDDVESSYTITDGTTGSTSTTSAFGELGKRAHALTHVAVPWEKDYFTTAFVDPQRGSKSLVSVDIADPSLNPALSKPSTVQNLQLTGSRSVKTASYSGSEATGIIGSFDILAFRAASALQKFLERSNIGGATKLTQLLAHWGVSPSPSVMQMSEYLGRNEYSLNIDEVISTADTSSVNETNLGDVTTKMNGGGAYSVNYHAKEHGFFICVQFIRPERVYLPGCDRRLFNRNFKEDYFNPEFEHISYQPIMSCELNPTVSSTHVFGYAPRYAEYKFSQSRYSGQYATPLYATVRPSQYNGVLNQTTAFTMIGTDAISMMDSVFATSDPFLDHFVVRWTINCGMKRPMSPYGQSTISDITGRDITIPYGGVRL
nr:MAG: major capsid protein [Microviridae sp.]